MRTARHAISVEILSNVAQLYESQLPLTDPRDAEAQCMLNIPFGNQTLSSVEVHYSA